MLLVLGEAEKNRETRVNEMRFFVIFESQAVVEHNDGQSSTSASSESDSDREMDKPLALYSSSKRNKCKWKSVYNEK